jgi:hypothetical protein
MAWEAWVLDYSHNHRSSNYFPSTQFPTDLDKFQAIPFILAIDHSFQTILAHLT